MRLASELRLSDATGSAVPPNFRGLGNAGRWANERSLVRSASPPPSAQ